MSFTRYNKDNGPEFNSDVKINWHFPTADELDEVYDRLDSLIDETREDLTD